MLGARGRQRNAEPRSPSHACLPGSPPSAERRPGGEPSRLFRAAHTRRPSVVQPRRVAAVALRLSASRRSSIDICSPSRCSGASATCEMVFVCSEAPADGVLDYYFSCVSRRRDIPAAASDRRGSATSARAVAAKLLDRPDLLALGSRALIGRPDRAVERDRRRGRARRGFGVPINGTTPACGRSGSRVQDVGCSRRRAFRSRSVTRTCAPSMRSSRPLRRSGGSGPAPAGRREERRQRRRRRQRRPRLVTSRPRGRLDALPEWYLADLSRGGVVEELVAGAAVASPSVQVDISPGADVWCSPRTSRCSAARPTRSTSGCRFPANPAYSPGLGRTGSRSARCSPAAGRSAGSAPTSRPASLTTATGTCSRSRSTCAKAGRPIPMRAAQSRAGPIRRRLRPMGLPTARAVLQVDRQPRRPDMGRALARDVSSDRRCRTAVRPGEADRGGLAHAVLPRRRRPDRLDCDRHVARPCDVAVRGSEAGPRCDRQR